nr:immunoglobulin heavy chain junction region [Mus musculus]
CARDTTVVATRYYFDYW